MIFTQSEGTAARCRFPLYLVDATDGITPETGEAGGQPQISKAGGAWANTTATLSALGNGAYYVELTATELNTLGPIQVRYKSANTAEFNAPGVVVAYNQHDTVRLGLTSLPNAAAEAAGGLYTRGTGAGQIEQDGNGRINANATHFAGTAYATAVTALVASIWNALTSGMSTVGSIGKKLADWTIHSAADVWAVATRVLTAATNITSTGGTTVPQTGDSFARIGAPAGASVSADIAAIEAQTDDIGVAGAGLTALASATDLATVAGYLDTEIAAIKAKTDNLPAAPASTTNITAGTITTVTNLTNAPTSGDLTATMKASVNTEVLDVLNTDTFAEPGQEAPAATNTLAKKIGYLFKFLRNKVTQTSTTLSVFADDGTTVDQKATVSDDLTTYTRGEIGTGP